MAVRTQGPGPEQQRITKEVRQMDDYEKGYGGGPGRSDMPGWNDDILSVGQRQAIDDAHRYDQMDNDNLAWLLNTLRTNPQNGFVGGNSEGLSKYGYEPTGVQGQPPAGYAPGKQFGSGGIGDALLELLFDIRRNR